MNSIVHSGTQIATEVHDSSSYCSPNRRTPKTLADLLDILSENPPSGFRMLKSTCALIAAYLEKTTEQISVDSVYETRDGFRAYLVGRKNKSNSIRSYMNFRRILLKSAAEFGWKTENPVPEAWRDVLALATKRECLDLARHLSRLRKTPGRVIIEDVDRWVEKRVQQGITHCWARGKKNRLWRLLRDCGCTEQLPICLLREKHYAVRLEQFPPSLKREATSLLEWKVAEFSVGRPKKGRHREVTSRNLRIQICRLFGFAVNVRGESEITSMAQLVQEQIVNGYVEFCLNERKVKGYGLRCALVLLFTVLNQHPSYKSMDFNWFKLLLDSIPMEHESEVKKRKAEKYLEYSVLESIPARIRAGRQASEKKGINSTAILALKELLVKWLVTLPWRQRNIRECRIGGSRPNLFKAAIPLFSNIDKPEWVKQEEQRDAGAEFWQFAFSVDETKTGIEVHCVLPRPLIGLLEEYLRAFRPHLLHGVDPETLFVNQAGNQMSTVNVDDLVTTLTYRFGGTRVTPHLFRDIVAFAWLKAHPKDYLTLSKMLWHSTPDQVIKTYGSRFNESSGVCAMESWLEEREAKST